jgi:hypothetical protein
LQGQNIWNCAVKAPVIIEASPGILGSLTLDEERNEFQIDADYVPQPGDDLYALVCSLFRLLINPKYSIFCTNGVENIGKIKLFWKQCLGCDGWLAALKHAENGDYEKLKEELDRIFHFYPKRPFNLEEMSKKEVPYLCSIKKISTERSPLSPQTQRRR